VHVHHAQERLHLLHADEQHPRLLRLRLMPSIVV
jgi:hypothetical protein